MADGRYFEKEGQHPLTGQRTANFNFSICAFHVCICFYDTLEANLWYSVYDNLYFTDNR